jgi:hypothetical protein
MKRPTGQLLHTVVLAGLLVAYGLNVGCTSTGSATNSAAAAKKVVALEPWQYRQRPALTARTNHYAIHTTIDDKEFLANLGNLMESSLKQYQMFTPGVRVTSDPMDCYVFARRTEWAEFTAQKTGADAALYLQINRGGYTVRDWYAAYFIGDVNTYAVVAHEGWHQYVARHFRSRLPPFLEEGIATMFENVRYSPDNGPPSWDLTPNASNRAAKLRRAIEANNLWPLEDLITMHAGEVVALPGSKIEAFYAQNWAFAEFLWDAEDGKYRPAFQRLLTDCANGTVYPAGNARRSVLDGWDPTTVKPMLEHYLCMDLADIERAYQSYCGRIAYANRNAFAGE